MTFHHMIHLASYRAHKAEHKSHNKHDNTGGRELTNQMRSLPEQSVREHTVESLCYAPKAILETPEESATSGNQQGNSENSYEPRRSYK